MTKRDPAEDADWAGYYESHTGRPVRDLLLRALSRLGRQPRDAVAVDLGCGDGTKSAALLRAGFRVFAVDSSVDVVRRTILAAGPEAVRLTATVEGFATYAVPPADLVYAGFSLPFCRPADFPDVWSRVRAALRPGGVVAVTLFGERDSWASEWDRTFVSAQRVDELTAGLDADIIEEERDGEAFSGPKHCHVFNVVAWRPLVDESASAHACARSTAFAG